MWQMNSVSGLARILPWGVQILIFVIKFPKFVEISNLTRKKDLYQVQSNFGLGVADGPLATPMHTSTPKTMSVHSCPL